MKQKYMVMVLLALIGAAGLTSFRSYRATERLVTSDMNQALALALAEQNTDVINSDTIQVFNSYLQLEQLRGQAVLAVDTRQRGFHCYAQCSTATIFSMSEQRPALALWTLAMLWITSQQGLTYCVKFDFNRQPELKSAFQATKDPKRLVKELALFQEQPIIAGETLMIFDEIQECEEALNSLKYFCEEASSFYGSVQKKLYPCVCEFINQCNMDE